MDTNENKAMTAENETTGNAAQNTCGDDNTAKKDAEEKLFTQAQLETLISERMKRERKNARALNSVKDALKSLQERGIISKGSYSDMADELCARLGRLSENSAADKGAENAGESFDEVEKLTVPENTELALPDGLRDDGEYAGEAEQEPATEENVNIEASDSPASAAPDDGGDVTVSAKELCRIKELYPNADINGIFSDRAFQNSSNGRRGALREISTDYVSFLSEVSEKLSDGFGSRRDYSGAASTAFSSDAKAYGDSYSERLTRRQMDIAKSSGMSYREYGELLDSIPRSPKKYPTSDF